MLKYTLMLLLLLITSNIPVCAQQANQIKISWKTLQDVRFTAMYNKEYQAHVYYPNFGKSVKSLAGQWVQLRGYAIPLDMSTYVLSAFPLASCFFCGTAGPESVVQLTFTTQPKLRTDQLITVQGKLRLNVDNLEELNYILEQTSILK